MRHLPILLIFALLLTVAVLTGSGEAWGFFFFLLLWPVFTFVVKLCQGVLRARRGPASPG